MAELTTTERLQPSLLDRLTDDEPDKTVESRDKRVMPLKRLRECVLRDLGWLLNTHGLGAVQDLSDYPLVSHSVVNYGVPALTGTTLSSMKAVEMQAAVQQAILDFEPRLIDKSLGIRVAVDQEKMSLNSLVFFIEADMWAQPLPERLYLRTEVDMEFGTIKIADVPGGR
jgi:type VI secretion system protein ImpF